MSPLTASDDRLTRLAASGDVDAFARIYDRHGQALYRYCLSILRDDEDARDALQSTMEALGGALGATRTQDPDPPEPRAAQVAPAAERRPEPKAKPELAPTPRERPTIPSSLAGYTQLNPSVTAVLADGEDGRASAGDRDGSEDGGSLAFTGLDALMLVLAGAALVGLGVLARRFASRLPA